MTAPMRRPRRVNSPRAGALTLADAAVFKM